MDSDYGYDYGDNTLSAAEQGQGPKQGLGLFGKFSNLMSNKLLQQILGSLGADLLGKTPGKNLSATIQNNISSQNYVKMLSKMLGGDFSGGGNYSVDEKGFKANIPHPGGNSKMSSGIPPIGESEGANDIQGGIPNPFQSGQPSFSASDLAGLDPQMISQALQFKMSHDEMMNRNAKEIKEMMFKSRNDEVMNLKNEAETERAKAATSKDYAEADKAMRPEDKRTAEQKNYEYAQSKGYTGSFEDFKNVVDTTEQKNYAEAVKQGYKGSFVKYQKELRESSATKISLGEELGKEAAKNKLKEQDYFSTSDWSKPIDTIDSTNPKVMSKAANIINKNPNMDDQEARNLATTEAKLQAVKGEIEARNGVILGKRQEGNTFIYHVKFPDIKDQNGKVLMKGSERDIRYVVK